MPRGGSRSRAESSGSGVPSLTPSDDIGWRFGTLVGTGRTTIRCNFCNKVLNGGITRLKEHLAHWQGNVAKCSKVPQEIRIDMMTVLQNYKASKQSRFRQREQLIDEINISCGGQQGLEDIDEEEMLEVARQESLRQGQFDDYRRSRGPLYHDGQGSGGGTGGSSGGSVDGPTQPALIGRSQTFRERRTTGSGRYRQLHDDQSVLTPLDRLGRYDTGVSSALHSKRQRSLGGAFNSIKSKGERLLKAAGKFFVHERIPFRAVESPYFDNLLQVAREVGENIPLPSAYQLTDVFLPGEVEECKNYIKSMHQKWDARGVTIMCDGWTSSTRMHIINFLVYSFFGTTFIKSVDATDVASRDTKYYLRILTEVVEEVGPDRVVHVVTDNEAPLKAAGKKLEIKFPHISWSPCAAHCIDLILEDIAKKQKFGDVIENAKKITGWIYSHNWVVNFMKKFTADRHLLRPGVTRFATNFLGLQSLIGQKTALRNMFESA